MQRFLVMVGALSATLTAIVACNDNGTTAQPPQLAEAANWVEVFERRTCGTLAVGASCLGQSGFHIDVDGRVSLGPENGPVDADGVVTVEEQNAVVSAANAVVEQDLSRFNLVCRPWSPEPNESSVILKVRETDDQLWTVFQKSYSTLQICRRGDEALADALFQAVDPLVDRYPVPTPTPSATPTTSPSPSPSSSP